MVSVRCMRPVFQYGVAFCAGLTFGMATTSFLGGQEPTLMISILVWGVAGHSTRVCIQGPKPLKP